MDAPIEVRRLIESDSFALFDCHDASLNRFIREQAKQNQRRGTSTTWLAVQDSVVVGFATIVTATTSAAPLLAVGEKRLSERVPAPVLLLARMGSHKEPIGELPAPKGVGSRLLRHVIEQAVALRELSGCVGVLVDSKPGSVDFYAKYRFVKLAEPPAPDAPTPMFLSMKTIEAAVAQPPQR